jgi:hypothetical protein
MAILAPIHALWVQGINERLRKFSREKGNYKAFGREKDRIKTRN